MARKARGPTEASLPESQWIYQYWVEVRDLRDGSTRTLPLSMTRRIHFPRKNEAQRPARDCLRLQDGAETLEASDLDELADLLRARYPSPTYERRLDRVRDVEAERRRAEGLQALAELVVKNILQKRERQ